MCRFFAVSDFLQKAIERGSEVATRTGEKARLQLGRAREKWGQQQQKLLQKSKRTGVSWIQKAVQSVKELAAELAEDGEEEGNPAGGESGKPEESRGMEKMKASELEEGDLVALEALDDEIRRFELNGCEIDAGKVDVGRRERESDD